MPILIVCPCAWTAGFGTVARAATPTRISASTIRKVFMGLSLLSAKSGRKVSTSCGAGPSIPGSAGAGRGGGGAGARGGGGGVGGGGGRSARALLGRRHGERRARGPAAQRIEARQ